MNTRQDYERAARLVADHPAGERLTLAQAFSEFFQGDNARFDESRFMVACGASVAPVQAKRPRVRRVPAGELGSTLDAKRHV